MAWKKQEPCWTLEKSSSTRTDVPSPIDLALAPTQIYLLFLKSPRPGSGRADSSIREEGVGGVDEGVGGGADWGLANRVPSWAGVNPFLGLHLRAGRRHVGVVARLGGNSSCIRFDPFQKPLRIPPGFSPVGWGQGDKHPDHVLARFRFTNAHFSVAEDLQFASNLPVQLPGKKSGKQICKKR